MLRYIPVRISLNTRAPGIQDETSHISGAIIVIDSISAHILSLYQAMYISETSIYDSTFSHLGEEVGALVGHRRDQWSCHVYC